MEIQYVEFLVTRTSINNYVNILSLEMFCFLFFFFFFYKLCFSYFFSLLFFFWTWVYFSFGWKGCLIFEVLSWFRLSEVRFTTIFVVFVSNGIKTSVKEEKCNKNTKTLCCSMNCILLKGKIDTKQRQILGMDNP